MKIKSIAMLFGGTLLGFAAVSCDSRQEQIRENAIEGRADAQEDAADAVRDGAEKRADELEGAADRTRESQ